MTTLAILLAFASAEPDAADAKKAIPPAQVAVTAELACLHCTFGEGDGCAVCLKIDGKTPVLLAGKAAKEFQELRLSRKVLVAEGTLIVNKENRLVLVSDAAHLFGEKDKGKAPPAGELRVVGRACCGRCDLGLCDECTLAIKNAAFPIVLDGKLAQEHAEEGKEARSVTVTGKPFLDKRGLLRINAVKVVLDKK